MGNLRLKYLQSVMHWVQDFRRVSAAPSIVGLNEVTFESQLLLALDRSIMRESLSEQTTIVASATSPGPLDSERK